MFLCELIILHYLGFFLLVGIVVIAQHVHLIFFNESTLMPSYSNLLINNRERRYCLLVTDLFSKVHYKVKKASWIFPH